MDGTNTRGRPRLSAGNTTIFYRSWYRRVLDDRLQGRISDKAVARAFDEINEFEEQLVEALCVRVSQQRLDILLDHGLVA